MHEQPSPDAAPTPRTLVSSLAHRTLLLYLALWIFPFPLDSLPGATPLAEILTDARQSAVTWLLHTFLEIDISVYPAGSGDTTYNYGELLVLLVLAALTAAAWTALRPAPVGLRSRDLLNLYVRFFLAATMLSYGWAKLIPLQMPYPGPDRLLTTFGDSSPMGLLWTFIGASPAYQILCGLAEFIAGALLLSRRTTLLGAIFSAAVLLNVVALNFCYDVPVKILSSHLLFLSLFLIAPHAPRLAAIFFFKRPALPHPLRPAPFRATWFRFARPVLLALALVLFAALPGYESIRELAREGPLAPRAPWHGLYTVESFSHNGRPGRELPDQLRWVRVGITSRGSYAAIAIQHADGASRRWPAEVKHGDTFAFLAREKGTPPELRFTLPDDFTIVLEGRLQGADIVARLKRLDESASTLTGRGFHWVSEFPFNR